MQRRFLTLLKKVGLLLLLLSLLPVAQVQAKQESTIYRCRDASGKLVFQQVACDESQVSGNTLAHQLWRKMRVISSRGRQILEALGADVESIQACQKSMVSYQRDLQQLRVQVSQQSRKHPDLVRAFTSLEVCGVCRTSAVSNCTLADQYLDKAMARLTEY